VAYEPRRNGRTYYYQKRWERGRCVSAYLGAGPLAQLAAQQQQQEQARRAQERAERERLQALGRTPAAAAAYRQEIRRVVCAVLEALGFHQHKRQWRKRMTTETALAREAHALLTKTALTREERQRFCAALDAMPQLAVTFGDMPEQARRALLTGYEAVGIKEAIDRRMHQLATALGADQATALERLLIDDILICWLDLYQFQAALARQHETRVHLAQQAAAEPILAAKHRRYLHAIEALARVRRLLKLTVQVNVAFDGAQQVNVQQPSP
jgi:hypothetical protein